VGFITCLNDILIPHLKGVFHLDYSRAVLIQFTFFGAYFLMSLPAGKLVSWLGYQRTMVVGLVTAGIGTLLFLPAADTVSYPCFLGAFFILATGITFLQVSANPYISALGRPETASSRLNLAQAFNSLGTTLAPWIGGVIILSSAAALASTNQAAQAAAVKMPYLILTGTLFALAAVIGFMRLPWLAAVEGEGGREGTFADALRIPHLSLGALGIFLYVGAEVSIGSFLINYLGDAKSAGLSQKVAAGYVALYWGGAMVGRFAGSALLPSGAPVADAGMQRDDCRTAGRGRIYLYGWRGDVGGAGHRPVQLGHVPQHFHAGHSRSRPSDRPRLQSSDHGDRWWRHRSVAHGRDGRPSRNLRGALHSRALLSLYHLLRRARLSRGIGGRPRLTIAFNYKPVPNGHRVSA
jgi:MFS family permease